MILLVASGQVDLDAVASYIGSRQLETKHTIV